MVGDELRGPVLTVAFAPDGALLAGLPREGIARSVDLEHWDKANAGLQANLVVAWSGAFVRGSPPAVSRQAGGGVAVSTRCRRNLAVRE